MNQESGIKNGLQAECANDPPGITCRRGHQWLGALIDHRLHDAQVDRSFGELPSPFRKHDEPFHLVAVITAACQMRGVRFNSIHTSNARGIPTIV